MTRKKKSTAASSKTDNILSSGGSMNGKDARVLSSQPANGGIQLQTNYTGLELHKVSFLDITDDEDDSWKNCLVGYFSPNFPGNKVLQKVVERFPCDCNFKKHPCGWIIFEFKKAGDIQMVLEQRPYYINERTLHLTYRPQYFDFSEEAKSFMSVWIQLPNLPLELWKKHLLERICTFIGYPIQTDKCTKFKERIGFARCLVEVDGSMELPNLIELELPNGKKRLQPVVYEKLARSTTII